MKVTRLNQVWYSDIYIPIHGSFMYLCVTMDWYSWKILSWSLFNSLDADFCISCLEKAIAMHRRLEIFNSDQSSQYTREGFTQILKEHGVKISVDGKGNFGDSIFIARLWKSLKYELICLKEFGSVTEMRRELGFGSKPTILSGFIRALHIAL